MQIIAVALLACSLAYALFVSVVPSYFGRGFPLDDAWIHAVYARSLVRELSFAYNPGEPATGATSLLWPALLALVHAVSPSVGAFCMGAKIMGGAFHVLASALIALALRSDNERGAAVPAATAVLFGTDPDLIAASVSGMEVSLGLAVLGAAMLCWREHNARLLFCLAALSYLARPELAVAVVLVPLAARTGHDRRALLRGGVAALGGALLSVTLAALRNWMVSGRPLPATFYAKVGRSQIGLLQAEQQGFELLFEQLSIVRFESVLAAAILLAIFNALTPRPGRNNAAASLSGAVLWIGLATCALSFALIPPIDPGAFYHQRYVLPGVGLIIAALPALLDRVAILLPPRYRSVAFCLVILGLVSCSLADAPLRFARLDNDAHNIDDVQVKIGKVLAEHSARSTTVVWTVDAGAVRYFARGFVVDLMGLNTPEAIGENAGLYLDHHRPHWLVLLPTWAVMERASSAFAVESFQATTAYTVTSDTEMRRQLLLPCTAPNTGVLRVVRGSHRVTCGR